MPSRTTRSGRTIKNAASDQSKLDALEILERQRRGEKVNLILEEEPLFEEVDEEEYKRTRGGRIDSDSEFDSDGDFYDDYEDDCEQSKSLSAKGKRNSKKRRHESEPDSRQKSLKGFLEVQPRPSAVASSSKSKVDEEDLLSQMLLDVRPNKMMPIKRLSKVELVKEVIKPPSQPEIMLTSNDHLFTDDFDDSDIAEPLQKRQKSDEKIFEQMATQESVDDVQYSRMYWYDCCEYKNQVLFFGRTRVDKRYGSCCVVVKDAPRTIYLLIEDEYTYEDIVGEFKLIAKRLHIKQFTTEKVTKKYAFSKDIPSIADYVKVDYIANQAVNSEALNGQTFRHVLNANQSPMEKMILDLKLRGPCWLKLVNPILSNNSLTWVKTELVIDSPTQLSVDGDQSDLKAPYFCALAMSLLTRRNNIIAISVMFNTSFNLDECLTRTNKASGHFMIMTKPPLSQKEPLKLPYDFQAVMKKYNKTRFELVGSEHDLLAKFMEKFSELDPDIVVGHDLLNFNFETLIRQMIAFKVGNWSRLGRLKWSELPSAKSALPYLFSGRILCDIKRAAEELIQSRSYDLTELTAKILNKKRVEYDHDAVVEAFRGSENLVSLLNASWDDVDNVMSIMAELNVMPLALKITNITGNILSRTLAAGRSERNEYLLLHAFHDDNYICPEKQINKGRRNQKEEVGRRKPAYCGGLVLEPKAGFYETCVLVMDFNSLYPSIIQEFNICFCTVSPDVVEGVIVAPNNDENQTPGILPTQLRNLVDRRRQVKRLIADCKQLAQKISLDIEQRALKLTANSMYGCLGFEQSRFYARHLASQVTYKGREILMSTKLLVEKLGYEVIYGDTDSLMIDTKTVDYDQVTQRGNSIKGEINKTFRLIEIDIDAVYKPLLLLKKKNYAGVSLKLQKDGSITKSVETKGLDTIRRDRAVVAKEAGEKVLSIVLRSEQDNCQIVEMIHNYLKDLSARIKADELPAEKFLISKQLNKNPEEYKDTKGIGHVSVALRHNRDPKSAKKMRSGDTIEYVVCLDNTSQSANQRCYSLHEMATNTELKLDYEYYLCQQIHPIMARICDKLPITNAYVLAEMMGVETSSLLHIKNEQSLTTQRDQLSSKGNSRFYTCKPLIICCPFCHQPNEISTRKQMLKLVKCDQCEYRYNSNSKEIVVQIISTIKQLTLDLYNSRFICDNSDCDYSTRNVFHQGACELCGEGTLKAEMDDKRMDLQLQFMRYLLRPDVRDESCKLEAALSDESRDMFQRCYDEVDAALRNSQINNIDTARVFSMVCSGRASSSD